MIVSKNTGQSVQFRIDLLTRLCDPVGTYHTLDDQHVCVKKKVKQSHYMPGQAQNGGRLSALRTDLVLIFTMGWSEGNMSVKNPVTPPGIDPGTVRLVAQRLNHYATPGPLTGGT